jgi:uncharacterized protein (DUF2235 family)
MPRNLILLSDGTGNSAAKLFKTNVWRTYEALDLSRPDQVAFYDDGVGTSTFKPLAILGGAFGWGLRRNIIALYTFLCRNYADGDRVFGFGFSRGAFTIRVLMRFVLTKGLVSDFGSSDELRRKGLKLYREFRRQDSLGRRPSEWIRAFVYLLMRPLEPRTVQVRRISEIEFIGLWDTVDAYGMPVEEFKSGIDHFIWPLSLNDRTLHPGIRKACHALSIDDRRMTFHPLLWDEAGKAEGRATHTDDEVLTQVWFAGVHSNVGGGYPDDGLSSVSLWWMVNEAAKRGLTFTERAFEQLYVKVAPFGRLYNSRAGLGAYYRYGPRRLDPPTDRQGAIIPHPKVHESVIWRMALGTDSYAPLSLPSEPWIVTDWQSARAYPRHPAADPRSQVPNVYRLGDYQRAVHEEGRPASSGPERRASTDDEHRLAQEIAQLQKPDPRASGAGSVSEARPKPR